jgi:membrane protease YdiL (CAAX protease family)
MVFIIGMSFIKNIFEEFAWRGYLAPKMYSLGINVFIAHVLVGLIWGAWHLPYLAFVTGYLKESSAFLIPCFLLGTIATSIVYGEIRLITNSVWPAVLMHTIGGAFIGALFMKNIFEIEIGIELLFSPGIEGVLGIVLFTLAGIGLYLLRKKRMRVFSTQP